MRQPNLVIFAIYFGKTLKRNKLNVEEVFFNFIILKSLRMHTCIYIFNILFYLSLEIVFNKHFIILIIKY